MRCEENCPLNNCQNKIKKCNGPHTATSRQCDIVRQHINKRYQQNTTLTYAQVLNKQQHKLDITEQQQNTKLTEIQKTLTTLQQRIMETQETQQTLINMINNLRTRTEERIEKVKNNVENIAI